MQWALRRLCAAKPLIVQPGVLPFTTGTTIMHQAAQPRYSVAPDVVFCELQDRLVLLDTRHGTYYSLNQVAADCWKLLAQPQSLDELVAGIARQYEIAPEQCQTDIARLLVDLVSADLLLERVDA